MKKILLLLSVPAMILAGCAPKSNNSPSNNNTPTPSPSACFSLSATLIDSGQTVSTSNCSTNAASYQWNFGQGNASISDSSAPKWTYSSPNTKATSTVYTVTMTAFNGDKSKSSKKDTTVTMGFRQIDSAVIVSSPSVTNGLNTLVQMGASANISQYSSPAVVVSKLPATFNFESKNIIISSKNNTAWKGHVFNATTQGSLTTFGSAGTVFFSRGLNASPIKVSLADGGEMDVYYHLVKQ